MDIRVITRDRRVVNVSRLSLEVQGRYVVGITEEQNRVLVESCGREEEAEEKMKEIIEEIREAHRKGRRDLLIELGE